MPERLWREPESSSAVIDLRTAISNSGILLDVLSEIVEDVAAPAGVLVF
jgi:hypothetical protein